MARVRLRLPIKIYEKYAKERYDGESETAATVKYYSEETIYPCLFCTKVFSCVKKVKKHIKTHSEVKAIKCRFCEEFFFSRKELNKHEKFHTDII